MELLQKSTNQLAVLIEQLFTYRNYIFRFLEWLKISVKRSFFRRTWKNIIQILFAIQIDKHTRLDNENIIFHGKGKKTKKKKKKEEEKNKIVENSRE